MAPINLTEAESRMLRWVNISGLNWEKAAKDLNYTSSKNARNKWYPVRDKVLGKEGAGTDKGGAKTTTGTKRKDSATSTPAPTAKKAKTTTKGKKAKSTAASEDEDEEESKVKDEEGEDFGLDGDLI